MKLNNIPFILLTMLLITACSRDSHNHPDLVTGKQLFNYHCSTCHKATGIGRFLKGVPANKLTRLSPGQITHKIVAGTGTGTQAKMPTFPNMPTTEAVKIANYVKTLH